MVAQHPSPNFGSRKGATPSMVIIHYTGMKTAEAALERLCDAAAEVSAHYMIYQNGDVVQLVDERDRAWHAGVSEWQGITDINSHSIGIELVNKGHEFGYEDFPEAQIKALIVLCQDIKSRHKIKWVLGHQDIAPSRKQDPGEKFPWGALAKSGIKKEQ